MGFLSGIIDSSLFSENALLDVIGGGPAGWGGSSDLWGGIGARIGFEVELNGFFGMPGASLGERVDEYVATNGDEFVFPGELPEGSAEGESVVIYDPATSSVTTIYDTGDSFGFFTREMDGPGFDQPPPEPFDPRDWASADAGPGQPAFHGYWHGGSGFVDDLL